MDADHKKSKKNLVLWFGALLFLVMLMAGMLLPSMCQSREKSRRINCAGNLKQIGLALIIYASDQPDQQLPPGDNFAVLNQQQYLVDGKVYTCPSATHPSTVAGISNYHYYGAGLTLDHPEAKRVVIAADHTGNHSTWCNFLFLDGHVAGTKQRDKETIAEVCKREGWILNQAEDEQ